MNGMLAAFNLLPGAPLDGGRILRAALWLRHGDRLRAAQSAAAAGRALGMILVVLGFADLLAFGDLGGLWLALIGVFIMTAAGAEASAETATSALSGLRVRDVMIPDPDVGAEWLSVAAFVDRVMLRSPQTAFPVVGADGTLAGATSLGMLTRIPPAARDRTPLRKVMAPVPRAYLAAPDDPAAPLLARPPLAGELAAIVVTDGRVIGLVTSVDLRRMAQQAALHTAPRQAWESGEMPVGYASPDGTSSSRTR